MFKIFSTDICWINIKWGIWRVILRPSYIWDARFLTVNTVTNSRKTNLQAYRLHVIKRQTSFALTYVSRTFKCKVQTPYTWHRTSPYHGPLWFRFFLGRGGQMSVNQLVECTVEFAANLLPTNFMKTAWNEILHIHCTTQWAVTPFQNDCYVVGSESFRPDQLFKVTEIKQLCYFSTQSPFISAHFSTDTLTFRNLASYI